MSKQDLYVAYVSGIWRKEEFAIVVNGNNWNRVRSILDEIQMHEERYPVDSKGRTPPLENFLKEKYDSLSRFIEEIYDLSDKAQEKEFDNLRLIGELPDPEAFVWVLEEVASLL